MPGPRRFNIKSRNRNVVRRKLSRRRDNGSRRISPPTMWTGESYVSLWNAMFSTSSSTTTPSWTLDLMAAPTMHKSSQMAPHFVRSRKPLDLQNESRLSSPCPILRDTGRGLLLFRLLKDVTAQRSSLTTQTLGQVTTLPKKIIGGVPACPAEAP